MPDDNPDAYRLSDDPPPERRYRPMPGVESSDRQTPDEPALKKFVGHDPFLWVLGLCVLVWVGLGVGRTTRWRTPCWSPELW